MFATILNNRRKLWKEKKASEMRWLAFLVELFFFLTLWRLKPAWNFGFASVTPKASAQKEVEKKRLDVVRTLPLSVNKNHHYCCFRLNGSIRPSHEQHWYLLSTSCKWGSCWRSPGGQTNKKNELKLKETTIAEH